MDRQNLFHRLEFDDELSLDDEIDPVATVQPVSSVFQWQWHLPIIVNAVPRQLEPQALLVRRLQQPRAKLPMHGNSRADDPPAQAPQLVFSAFSAPLR